MRLHPGEQPEVAGLQMQMCDSKIADIKFNWKENESEAGLASCMLTRGCVLRATEQS